MKQVALLDYGAGNVASVRKAFEHLGAEVSVVTDGNEPGCMQRIVLPGVGHFSATAQLEVRGLRAHALQAISQGVPFLGICVGLQWLFEGSEESPDTNGAGVFAGVCRRLPDAAVKVPHVGWNTLEDLRSKWLLRGLPEATQVYFTHSYAAPIVGNTAATTTHGARFTAAVEAGQIGAVQFHPEKSGDAGLTVLQNFLELPC